jgi:anti-anti-sigma factor
MAVKIRQEGKIAVLDLAGPIVIGESAKAFREVTDEQLRSGYKKIIVIMTNVSFIDSIGTAELISAYNRIIHAGGDLVLVPPRKTSKPCFSTLVWTSSCNSVTPSRMR